ncbi:hypothetical protein HDU98_006289 [Podochytrium sp. JEL0797]|nr:hypothetical protein HDU98_006289 [Podochytrium sp. JEL0797]
MTGLGMIFCLLLFIFLVKFRNLKEVKRASVPECMVILGGSLLVYASLPLYLNTATTAKCVARICLALLGYALVVISIVMKNSVTVCTSGTKNHLAHNLLIAYTSLIHIALLVLAYLLKDADPMFNESPALMSIFALVGILVGVMEILPSNPSTSQDLVQCICLWLAVTGSLILLFGKKVYDVLFERLIERGILNVVCKSSEGSAMGSVSGLGVKSPVNALGGGSAPQLPRTASPGRTRVAPAGVNKSLKCEYILNHSGMLGALPH